MCRERISLKLFSNVSYCVMKRRLLLIAASLCLCSCLTAQILEGDKHQIVAHRLWLQLFPSANSISCIDTLTIRKKKNREKITIGLLPVYRIESVQIKGKEIKTARRASVVELLEVPSDTLFEVVVQYSGELRFQSEFTKMSEERAVLREEEILPHSAQMLQFVRMKIIVPADWQAISVGKLVSHSIMGDSTAFVWESDERMPSIGWICAGKYWNSPIRLFNDGSVSIALSNYFFEEESTRSAEIISLMENVLRFYSSKFSPYRFAKLSVVEVEDWVGGKNVLAIAAPSFIMVKASAFTTEDAFNKVQSILPHEIAHQWFPLTVFISPEDLAFLSEGMCEYAALLYAQSHGVMTSRDSLNNHPLLRSLLMRVRKEKDVPLQQKADLRTMPTQYLKASYVHHMLRQIVGDTDFELLYRTYAQNYALLFATLKDFQALAEQLSGKRLDWFFEQWVKGKGVPRLRLYNVKSIHQDNQWRVKGRVRIVGYEKYTTFADVGVKTQSGVTTVRVWLGVDSAGIYRSDVPFEVAVTHKPLSVLLDPDGHVLKFQKLPVRLGDLRDPSDGVMIVGTSQHTDHLLHLARTDSAEMERAGWSITIKFDSTATLADVQRERVFLYGKSSDNRLAAEYEKKFPFGFRGDSIVVNQQSLFDSTLTLIQVIESPFIPDGLLCWIAPSSKIAKPKLLPYEVSWILLRENDEVISGTWEVRDTDLVVEIQ